MPIKIDTPAADGFERSRDREPGGLTSRISRVSKAPPPQPKGKGIVLLLLGVAVIYALVDTFTSGSSASRSIEKNHVDDPGDNPPVAPGASSDGQPAARAPVDPGGVPADPNLPLPADPVDQGFRMPGADIDLPEGLPDSVTRKLRLNLFPFEDLTRTIDLAGRAALAALPPIVDEVPEERRSEVRSFLLARVAHVAHASRFRGPALTAAAWLARDTEALDRSMFELLRIALQDGLPDDAAAPGAIALLGSLPDRGGAGAVGALDDVILDPTRPLHVRVAAARIRPEAGRSQAMHELAKSHETHPLLRDALAGETR